VAIRYGAEDRIGSLNEIRPTAIVAASEHLAAVRIREATREYASMNPALREREPLTAR
jgi:hypothetical protein